MAFYQVIATLKAEFIPIPEQIIWPRRFLWLLTRLLAPSILTLKQNLSVSVLILNSHESTYKRNSQQQQQKNFFFFVILSGYKDDGSAVFLRDIWPTRAEIQTVEQKHVIPAMFKQVYSKIEKGSNSWASLEAPVGKLYPWKDDSTYIRRPPFFSQIEKVIIVNQA